MNVEQDDIAALQQVLNGLTAPDLQQVYTHLLAASRMHLAAFQSCSADQRQHTATGRAPVVGARPR